MSKLSGIFMLSNHAQWFGSFLLIVFTFFLVRKGTKEIKIIGWYGLISFVFSFVQTLFFYLEVRVPNAVGNIYVIFETCMLLFMFYTAFNVKTARNIVLILGISYLCFSSFVVSTEITSMTSSTRAIRDVLMIICSIVYFFFLLRELPEEKLTELPMFWVNSAILFFFSCTFMLSLSLTYLIDVLNDNLTEVWTFRNFLRFIFCLIICYGIWKARKHTEATITT